MMKLGLWTNVSRVARERLSHVFRADAARETSLCPNTLKRARLKIGGDLAGRANALSPARMWKRNVQVAPLAVSLWRPHHTATVHWSPLFDARTIAKSPVIEQKRERIRFGQPTGPNPHHHRDA